MFAAGFDGVMHFAAVTLVGESVELPERYWRGNVVGTLNLLDAMRAAGVRRLVFSSTAATYGEPDVDPIAEDTPKEPDQPVRPHQAGRRPDARRRARAARLGRGLAALLQRRRRERGALGEDHDPETHLIPLVLQAAAASGESVTIFGEDYPTPDGTAVRDYVHIDDLGARAPPGAREGGARAAMTSTTSAASAGYSVREVIDTARAVTGRAIVVPRRAGGRAIRRGSWPPNARARSGLGWAPEKTLEDMVRDAWTWHQAPAPTATDRSRAAPAANRRAWPRTTRRCP